MPRNKKAKQVTVDTANQPALPSALPIRYFNAPRRAVWQQYTQIGTEITIDYIDNAIQKFGEGDFQHIGILYENMFRDTTVQLAIQKRIDALLSCDIQVVAPTEDPDDVDFALYVQENFETAFPETQIEYLLSQWLLLNTAIGTIEWKAGTPTIKGLHPMWLYNYVHLYDRWTYQTRDDGRVTIDMNVDNDEKLAPEQEQVENDSMSITSGKKDAWLFDSKWHRGSRTAPITALAHVWYKKRVAEMKWIEATQNFSAPIQVIHYPEDMPIEQQHELFDSYVDQVENKIVMVPTSKSSTGNEGVSIELIPMASTVNPELYSGYIKYADQRFQIAFLHGSLSTEINSAGGNRAAAEVHHAVEKQLTIKDAKWLNKFLKTQVLRLWAQQRYPTKQINLPDIKFDFSSGIEVDDRMDAIKQLTEVIDKSLVKYEIENLVETAAQYGIKLKRVEKINEETTETSGTDEAESDSTDEREETTDTEV